jgi:hypothetical protein
MEPLSDMMQTTNTASSFTHHGMLWCWQALKDHTDLFPLTDCQRSPTLGPRPGLGSPYSAAPKEKACVGVARVGGSEALSL